MARIEALQQCTLRRVSLELRAGPIKACTLVRVMDGDTSYHIILGQAVDSTYHQCVKAIWRGKFVTIEAIRLPYDRLDFLSMSLYY